MIVRHPTLADLAAVLELATAYEREQFGDTEFTEDGLRQDWEDLDLANDAWVVDVDGRVAGYATIERRGRGRFLADGYVDPAFHGRGVGARLLDVTEDRARELGAKRLENATLSTDHAALELFEERGYVPVRHFFRMTIDLVRPPERSTLRGIEVRPFRRKDAAALVAVINEAFANEWGFRPGTVEDFERRRLSASWARPDLWWVALDGEELVGEVVCDWKRHGDWGWVGGIGVRPAWRGRGIGEALLRAALRRFYELGERRVALGVDAANPTGATRLYERVGMTPLWEAVVVEKQLDG